MHKGKQAAAVVGDQVTKAKVLLGSGIVKPYGPRKLAQLVKTLQDLGRRTGGRLRLAGRAQPRRGRHRRRAR